MYLYKQIWLQFFCIVFLCCLITEVRYKQKESSRPLFGCISFLNFFFYPLGGRGLGTENIEVLPCYWGGGRGKGALDFGDGHWGVMKVFSCHIDPNVITAILSGTSLKYHQKAFSYQAE